MLNRFVIIFLAVLLNTLHFLIPAKVINYSFNPILGVMSLGLFFIIVFITSSFRKDLLFLSLLSISLITQITSYYSNGGGVSDYINLYFLNSNIPDFMISLTLLTWWYQRVYKQHQISPADLEPDV